MSPEKVGVLVFKHHGKDVDFNLTFVFASLLVWVVLFICLIIAWNHYCIIIDYDTGDFIKKVPTATCALRDR